MRVNIRGGGASLPTKPKKVRAGKLNIKSWRLNKQRVNRREKMNKCMAPDEP